MTNLDTLTHSRQQSFKTCRKRHWFEYEIGIRKETDPKALRMGSAVHDACEVLENTGDIAQACEAIYRAYDSCPDGFDAQDWLYEGETVLRLITGYEWRWSGSGLKFVHAEMGFALPLVNPATGKPSKTFGIAGKIDGIVTLPDGRLAVLERKTTSDDIGSDSDTWPRLQIDQQISMYVTAARRLGFQVDAVLYDVIRKPTIKPTKVPILDKLGCKIVLDKNGQRVINRTASGKDNGYRQTGDKAKGYVLQERPMTAEEWGNKLSDDIAQRPDFYFIRREVPRLDQDLREFEAELWDVAKAMRAAQRDNLHYRTVSKDTCTWCSYFGLCTSGWKPGDSLPEGFAIVSEVHPELQGVHHGNSTETPASPAVESTPASA